MEFSAIMPLEIGVTHVIIGHRERRAYFSEANDFINKKVIAEISNSLVPILCVGETMFFISLFSRENLLQLNKLS